MIKASSLVLASSNVNASDIRKWLDFVTLCFVIQTEQTYLKFGLRGEEPVCYRQAHLDNLLKDALIKR